jgi:alkaline phosphatase D
MVTQFMNRRQFVRSAASAVAFPSLVRSLRSSPQVSNGIQIGDPLADAAIVWARADRTSQLIVEYSSSESFRAPRRVLGPVVTADSDFTGRVDLKNLQSGQKFFVRVRFEDRDGRTLSEPAEGSFRTAPAGPRDVRFLWSGDTAGQGFGINPSIGGMRIYETMRRLEPDFFIHSGDTIYADNPVPSEIPLPGGNVWKNLTTEAKSKVAETLDEFRGNFLYNLMDDNVRRFGASVPQIWQWDDHEVHDNWSPGLDLRDSPEYKVKDVQTLVQRARRAFLDYAPMRFDTHTPRIYRRIQYGPLLDVFMLDMRSYRSANNFNRQETESNETVYIGAGQLGWLQHDLKNSRATWKIIASDMPLGVIVKDGVDAQIRPRFENSSNGDGPPLGRELEIARLLSFIQKNYVRNVVWLTADVHYTAAHFYDPAKAQFRDFDPFWEFVSGPLNAGTGGPNIPDNTFGIQVVYQKVPVGSAPDRSPMAGLQFFGEVQIEARTRLLTVNLRDLSGTILFSKTLEPVLRGRSG